MSDQKLKATEGRTQKLHHKKQSDVLPVVRRVKLLNFSLIVYLTDFPSEVAFFKKYLTLVVAAKVIEIIDLT